MIVLTREFCRNTQASFPTAFAVLIVPLVLSAGLAMQYVLSSRQQVALQHAADAAALAATKASTSYLNQLTIVDDDAREHAVQIAVTSATKSFQSNAAAAKIDTVTPNVTVAQTGTTLKVTVSFATAIPGLFSNVLGLSGISIDGRATATYEFPSFIDIHVLVDASSSMGLGATVAIQDQMRTDSGLGCVFGCHVNESPAYTYARSRGYRMRIDVLRDSLRAMVQAAINQSGTQSRPTVRIALYAFSNDMTRLASPTYDLQSLLPKVETLNLASTGGGTDFFNALRQLRNTITKIGDGQATNSPKAFVFLITDGVEDGAMGYQHEYGYNFMWDPDNPMPRVGDWGVRPMPASYCNQFKDSGITMSVLYTKYTTFDPVTEYRESNINSNVVPGIPTALLDCSSGAGNFYQADRPEDIDAAIQTMFARATAPLRLSR